MPAHATGQGRQFFCKGPGPLNPSLVTALSRSPLHREPLYCDIRYSVNYTEYPSVISRIEARHLKMIGRYFTKLNC